MQVLKLTGSPRERGRIHGETLRQQIEAGLEIWERNLEPPLGRTVWEDREAFLASLDLEPSFERWVPGILDEIDGIAEGANQPRERVFAYNLLDEYWCWDASRRRPQDGSPGACSAVGLGPERVEVPVVAQNLDLPRSFEGSAVALDVEDDHRPRTLLLTAPGTVGFCGVNELGTAVCCNALPSLRYTGRGVPVLGIVRGILRRPSVPAVHGFLTEAPHASPQNYLVGDPGGVHNFECSAESVVKLDADGGGIWHTNHALANRDLVHQERPELVGTSFERAGVIEERLPEVGDRPGVLGLLKDRSAPLSRVGRTPLESHTWASIVSELSVPPRVEIAPGPPDRVPFETVWGGENAP